MNRLIKDKVIFDYNVLDGAKQRLIDCFKRFDKVVVSFSGGKDSTIVLNLALEVANELNRLPLEVVLIDEEALTFHTHEYAERVANRKGLEFKWYCTPVKHRNACSNNEPWWYPWEPSKHHLWCRELPKKAITNHPRFKPGQTLPEFCDELYQDFKGNVVILTGVRAQESLRRRTAVLRKSADNYISHRHGNTHIAHPIYDWSSKDVWLAIHKFNWDYNTLYDEIDKMPNFHNHFTKQRISNPFGEEPLRGIDVYQLTDKALWDKMQDRVRGARTALRYANAGLYTGRSLPPNFKCWKDYFEVIMTGYEEPYKTVVQKSINASITRHYKETTDFVPDKEPHPKSGCSWKFLCDCAIRGDFKNRKGASMKYKRSYVKPDLSK